MIGLRGFVNKSIPPGPPAPAGAFFFSGNYIVGGKYQLFHENDVPWTPPLTKMTPKSARLVFGMSTAIWSHFLEMTPNK